MGRFVALLRAVNVGARKLPMVQLREVCAGLGWSNAATYIQSGNVVFDATGAQAELEQRLEFALKQRIGFEVPVMVRSREQWAAYPGANPFPDAAAKEPNRLMLMVSKQPAAAGAAVALQERARDGERIAAAGDAIWIHYPSGAGTSRLSPSLIDRTIGSPATARNFRTVLKLEEMLAC